MEMKTARARVPDAAPHLREKVPPRRQRPRDPVEEMVEHGKPQSPRPERRHQQNRVPLRGYPVQREHEQGEWRECIQQAIPRPRVSKSVPSQRAGRIGQGEPQRAVLRRTRGEQVHTRSSEPLPDLPNHSGVQHPLPRGRAAPREQICSLVVQPREMHRPETGEVRKSPPKKSLCHLQGLRRPDTSLMVDVIHSRRIVRPDENMSPFQGWTKMLEGQEHSSELQNVDVLMTLSRVPRPSDSPVIPHRPPS